MQTKYFLFVIKAWLKLLPDVAFAPEDQVHLWSEVAFIIVDPLFFSFHLQTPAGYFVILKQAVCVEKTLMYDFIVQFFEANAMLMLTCHQVHSSDET